MYRVLMPIDRETKRALAQSQAVASLPAATESVEVVLLHVFDSEEEATETELGDILSPARALSYLTEHEPVAAIETVKRWGTVAEEVLAVADEYDVDLIVLGGRKRSKMGALLFGSVTTDVMRNADRPITVTGDSLKEDREHPVYREVETPFYVDDSDQSRLDDREEPVKEA